MDNKPHFLLINPPIYDFAAYDLWTKPVGLLYLSSIFKGAGADVSLIDCLDRGHPLMPESKNGKWGCGRYYSELTEKPGVLKGVPRKYSRFGLPKEGFIRLLKQTAVPDVIFVTSVMTYWYPGVFEVIEAVKRVFPQTPVILGGIYATICQEHAMRYSCADHVVSGDNVKDVIDVLSKSGISLNIPHRGFIDYPPIDLSFYPGIKYGVIKTSSGCPFSCSYCASGVLHPSPFARKPAGEVVAELIEFYKNDIKDVSFYDDALLFDPDKHILPILEGVVSSNTKLNLHTPNGLHARFVTPRLARLMKKTGFVMPRLSLDTADPKVQKNKTDGKVSNEYFVRASTFLKEAGFGAGEYGAYVLMGMPEQDLESVEKTIVFAHEYGARVFVAEYSPIPLTRDWEAVKTKLPSEDPLWHNNSVFPLYTLSDWPKLQRLKDLARNLNNVF